MCHKYSFSWSNSVQRIAFSQTVRELISEHTTRQVCLSLNVVASHKTEVSSLTRLNQRHGDTESTRFLLFVFVWFFIGSLWHRGLHAPRRRAYLRKTDFYTQRVVGRKETPRSLNISSSPSHLLHCPSARSLSWIGARRRATEAGAEAVPRGRGVEPWSLASVQNQPFLPEGRRLSPLDWNPILFYTEIEL